MRSVVRIGTRGSRLALWQARAVASTLETTGVSADLVVIRTSGDRLQEAPLADVGGKRLFVKEIEDALLRHEIDLAVHSAKDLPADLPGELTLAATLRREDPRDVIVLRPGGRTGEPATLLGSLGAAPRIGTSSIRRTAQLTSLAPGATFAAIRGNVDTRLRKLDEGEYDALVLAAAGMRRLGFGHRISAALPIDDCIPAPGQGIIAVQIRSDDEATRRALAAVHDDDSARMLGAERAVVAELGGGCQLPLGALATLREGELELRAIVCSADGSRAVRARERGPAANPEALGRRVAERLAGEGADAILAEVRRAQGPVEGSY